MMDGFQIGHGERQASDQHPKSIALLTPGSRTSETSIGDVGRDEKSAWRKKKPSNGLRQ
jgi:hypothetical protein